MNCKSWQSSNQLTSKPSSELAIFMILICPKSGLNFRCFVCPIGLHFFRGTSLKQLIGMHVTEISDFFSRARSVRFFHRYLGKLNRMFKTVQKFREKSGGKFDLLFCEVREQEIHIFKMQSNGAICKFFASRC